MKTTPLALLFLSLLPALAHADSVCQVRAESDKFELLQDGVRQNTYQTVEQALDVLGNMVDQGVCQRSGEASECALSSWDGVIYVDHITYDHRSKAFESRDAQVAAAYLAKLEKLGFCKIAVNEERCSLTIEPGFGDRNYFTVVQHDDSRDHSKAYFAKAEDAIRWRAGLADGKGCTIAPQALECTITPSTHLIRKDSYLLAVGPDAIEYKDMAQAIAARDALMAAKACVAPRVHGKTEESPVAPSLQPGSATIEERALSAQ